MAGVLTAVLAFAGLVYRADTVHVAPEHSGTPYAPAFRDEASGPGAMLNAHDGQAFGSLRSTRCSSIPSAGPAGVAR